jgi:DNA primase
MVDAVRDLLEERGVQYKIGGQDYLIRCLNPEHNDSNPSMRVDKSTGIFHCFSCGHKGNLFKFYGVFTNNTSIRVKKLKDKLVSLKSEMTGLELPRGAQPVTTNFRGISKETLQRFEAFTTIHEENMLDRIIFPIKDIRGKTVVFQGRHQLSDAKPKYINYPSGVELPIYPINFGSRYTSVVFVEGIFDMLNLHDKGLKNCSCVFGTSTLQKDTAKKLLPLKVQGITKVYLLFDNDTPGIQAAEKLKPLIEACELEVEIINLDDSCSDPGELPQSYVDSIREYVCKENT